MVGEEFTYRGTEKNVIMRAKELSWRDKYYLFGDHSDLIEDDKFQVIYISINNLSNTHYVLSPGLVGLKQVPCRAVAKAMKKTSSIGRLAVYYLFGGVPIPLYVVAANGGSVLLATASTLSFGLGVIGLIGLAQGIKSIVMNTRVRKDIEEKILDKKRIIHSGQQYDGLIFVKASDYHPTFAVTMHEKNNADKTITFDVDLRQNG
jgi:hypothetical protein